MITRDDIALGWWRALPPYRVDMKAAWQLPEYSATNPPPASPWARRGVVTTTHMTRLLSA